MRHLANGSLSLAMALVLVAVACESPAPPAVAPSAATATDPLPAPNGVTMKQAPSPSAPQYGPRSPMVPGAEVDSDLDALDDGQLAGIVRAIHETEAEMTTLASARAVTPAVRSFARDASEAHRAADDQLRVILGLVGVVPTGCARSASLRADAQSEVDELQLTDGRDFDRRFVDEQVALHRMADDLLDGIALKTKNPMLKAQIKADLAVIDDRLLQARRLQQALAGRAP